MTDPFVVVGGDAAGLSAASKLRREDPDRDVVVFERGAWVSYAHCGMPYYVKGEVDAITDLLTLRPSDVEDRGIDLRRGHEVTAIHPDANTVTVEHDGGVEDHTYGDLLVATGARAVTDPVPGIDLDGAFTMHDMDAAAALRAFLEPPSVAPTDPPENPFVDATAVEHYAARDPPRTAAVVGGGYVGVEMAEALASYDLDVTVFQRGEQLLPPFGDAVADRVDDTLRDHGVTVRTGAPVEGLAGDGTLDAVLAGDERVPADLAVVGVGVTPNAELVDGLRVPRHGSGAIRTDRYGRTGIDGVYAAGDCAAVHHAVTGVPAWVPLGLTANRAGRAVGQTVAGDPTPVGEIAGTAAVKAFDLECARTGILDHDRAVDAGFDPVSETVDAASRSGYYPGAAETTVTVTADRGTGRLLGGAIAGTDRAAVRIDTLATAVEAGLSVAELERLDLAYAPPFSPVWDPVLVAAKVLNGSLTG